jgi:hypothetical protein
MSASIVGNAHTFTAATWKPAGTTTNYDGAITIQDRHNRLSLFGDWPALDAFANRVREAVTNGMKEHNPPAPVAEEATQCELVNTTG